MGVTCKKECILGVPHMQNETGRGKVSWSRDRKWLRLSGSKRMIAKLQMDLGRGFLGWCGLYPVMHQWQIDGTGGTRLPPTPRTDITNESQHSLQLGLHSASESYSRPPGSHYSSIGIGIREVTYLASFC